MVLSRGLSGIAITLIVCLFVQGTHSFFPTTWKEVIFGYGGTSHQEQTEIAFAALAAKYFPAVEHLTKSMIKARDTICEANAKVDEVQTESALHCDGENFDGAQVRLQKLHNAVINQLALGLPDEARKSLGSALHTVQDFYAHSNWIELGNAAPNSLLGRASALPHAGPLDPTCADCLPHSPADDTLEICPNCRSNTLGFMPLLTSGYYVGEDAVPATGVAKCHHGGFTDGNVFKSITIGPSNPGINKDSLYCGWSPHYYLHTQAVSVSIAATEQYIDDLKAIIPTSQLRQLFGVGPTLAFCIDTTGSMGDIIATVQDASIQIVTERLGTQDEPSTYIISPFNDPSTGPVTTTSDVEEFKSGILSLGAGGGGDCPELSFAGMIDAINVMDAESILFMFTDAAAGDFSRAGELILLALEKSIKCYIFKFDSGCDDGDSGGSKVKRVDSASDSVYGSIALATGGGYHSLPREAATNITTLVDTLTMSDSNFVLRITDSLPVNGSAAYLVPVDSSLTQLTISLRGEGARLIITNPTGAPLDPSAVGVAIVTFADGSFVTVKSPKVGSWRVEVSGTGDFSLDASGIGPLHFSSFIFARLIGRAGHLGYFKIPGSPPYNADVAAIAAMNGPWSTAEFSFRLPDGTTLTTLSMIQGTGAAGDPPSNEFFTQLRLTPVDRYIYVNGIDSAGTFYQRLIPTAYTPILSNETFPLGNITGPPSNTNSSLSSSSSATVGDAYTAVTELPIYPVYPVSPDESSPSTFSLAASSRLPSIATHRTFANSSSSLATTTALSLFATHGPFANSTSSVHSKDPRTSKPVSSLSASRSLALSPSPSLTVSDMHPSLISPPSSGSHGKGTSVTHHSNVSTKTSPSGISTLDPKKSATITSEVVTITTECPVTLSSTISVSVYTTVMHPTSTTTATRTSTIPYEECKEHVNSSIPVTNVPSLTSASNEPPVATESELPPVTVTEIVYIITSTCPVIIGTTICSGSTSYIFTHSVTTQTLTSITTAPCDKCGPHTITLRVVSVPPTVLAPYVTPSPLPIGPPGYITLHVGSVPVKSSPAYITPTAIPSLPECYGGDCEISFGPSPITPSRPVYSPPPTYPTSSAPPNIPAVLSIPECHGPGCPGVPFTPVPGSPGHECNSPGCPDILPSPPAYIPPPGHSTAPAPPLGLICRGSECSVSPPLPGNATVNIPPATPTAITYTGDMVKSFSLVATTVALGLIISIVIGIIML